MVFFIFWDCFHFHLKNYETRKMGQKVNHIVLKRKIDGQNNQQQVDETKWNRKTEIIENDGENILSFCIKYVVEYKEPTQMHIWMVLFKNVIKS